MKFFVIWISFLLFGEASGGGSSSNESKKTNERPKTNALAQRMSKLLSTGAYADVQFTVEEGDKKELLFAHKAILSHASEEFASILCFDAQNSSDSNGKKSAETIMTVMVTDVPIEAFKVMLSFIYTEDLKGLTAQNLLGVLFTAKKYKIIGLINACVAFPISQFSNVFEVIAEARLLDMALRWADAQCRRNGTECSAENRRAALGQALFEIRIPIIKKTDFSLIIAPSGMLTAEEVISIYQFHAHPELIGAPGGLPPLRFAPFPSREKAHRTNSRGTLRLEISKFSEFSRGPVGSERLGEHMFIRGIPLQILAKVSSEIYLGLFIRIKAPVAEGMQLNRREWMAYVANMM
ncbi:hypothetical protein niasHS_009539 [Heterodera schachtii]|uniref:BTB domain-containing protein n=1 Tax=Heterodera schachtii TaxID=97005 RepID=A0ABD2JEM9_HETSC